MSDIKESMKNKRLQRAVPCLVGVDFSSTATKVVRLKKGKDGLVLTGIDLLPAIDFGRPPRRVELPRNMMANYGCLTYTGASSVVRMLNVSLPKGQEELPDSKLQELLNVGEDYRVGAMLVKRGQGRQDSSLMAAAIPEKDVGFLLSMFPGGPPAPTSVEVSGLSFVQAFLHARGEECRDEAVCLIEAGDSVCHFAFLNKGSAVLVGKFDFGGSALRAKVAQDLGVDDELAGTILRDQSINISSAMTDVMAPLLKQLSISKDFIERHQSCHISKVYVSGGLSLIPHWSEIIEQMLHVEVFPWSPFENIKFDQPNIVPKDLAAQATRFAAAVGAVIGGFEES
ncbi:MAG: pilus assembly protein PilM [Verrucomicrobiota bacterium]